MTLTGSLVAFAKLKGGFNILGKWRRFPTWGPPWLNPVKAISVIAAIALIYISVITPDDLNIIWGLIALSCILGVILVMPIGGADMPVSQPPELTLRHSAAFTGFIISNPVLIMWVPGGSGGLI